MLQRKSWAFGLIARGNAAIKAGFGRPWRFLAKRRLRVVYSTRLSQLPPAQFRLRCGCQNRRCAAYAEELVLETRQFVQVGRQAAFSSAFRPTALVIDLRRFPDCAAYMAAVGRETKGKYRRSANKAKRLGYHVRRIDPRSFPDSTRQIWSSKLIRSRGPVLEALLKREAASKDIELPLAEVPCHQHWVAGWGVFIDRDGKTRMVARAILRRAGNVVSIDQFMGHGDLLGDGVTKLLMFAIMQWILDRKDPSAQGLEYCFQGAIEDGSKGLVNWKRYTQFEPRACETDDQGVFRFPEGFDPRVYLELNPDVRAAGIDPKRHYLRHGLDEGRPYLR